jgi:selenoprotein W-related protein
VTTRFSGKQVDRQFITLLKSPNSTVSPNRYSGIHMPLSGKPRIDIEYCTQCRWLLRAAWMAQELLVTFEQDIGGVTLVPGTGGIFEIRLEGVLIWSRAEQARFPEIKELKRLVRDMVAPGKDLGHVDR